MHFHKKVVAILVVVLILIVVFLCGVFAIFNRSAQAPTESSFKGPDSAPYAKGPSTPPPSY